MLTRVGCEANAILRSLPDDEFERLAPRMSIVDLKFGSELQHPGERIGKIYFPINCVISVVCSMVNGAGAEVLGVGSEGALGIGVAMGRPVATRSARVVVGGYAAQLSSDDLVAAIVQGGELNKLLIRYTQARMELSIQNAACARFHEIPQQLAKWLLLSMDRHQNGEMKLTHDSLAQALGVRRESVTAAAGMMRRRGWIQYSRGCFEVLDRKGLESQACECYGQAKDLMVFLHGPVEWRGASGFDGHRGASMELGRGDVPVLGAKAPWLVKRAAQRA